MEGLLEHLLKRLSRKIAGVEFALEACPGKGLRQSSLIPEQVYSVKPCESAIFQNLRKMMEKRHVVLDDFFERLESPSFLPVGDIALDFSHPGIFPTRGLFQVLHHHLPHVLGQGRPLRTTA